MPSEKISQVEDIMDKKTTAVSLVKTALMMAAIVVATMPAFPVFNGYIHLGDSMIFLSVLLLGWRRGAVASGIGSAMADILLGYAVWAPWTLVIKAVMALAVGVILGNSKASLRRVFAMIAGVIVMLLGYFIGGGLIYGDFRTALLSVPWNALQGALGIIIANLLFLALTKTPLLNSSK